MPEGTPAGWLQEAPFGDLRCPAAHGPGGRTCPWDSSRLLGRGGLRCAGGREAHERRGGKNLGAQQLEGKRSEGEAGEQGGGGRVQRATHKNLCLCLSLQTCGVRFSQCSGGEGGKWKYTADQNRKREQNLFGRKISSGEGGVSLAEELDNQGVDSISAVGAART